MIAITLLLLILPSAFSLTCNSSSYEFTSVYSLGKQDQLNRTFTKIQSLLPGLDYAYTFKQTNTTYKILNFTSIFKYVDTNQKSEVIDDTILVWNGYLRIDFSFNWTKTTSTNTTSGNATGTGRTYQCTFSKNIIINSQGFPMFNLYGHYQMWWDNYNLTIQRINPYTQEDYSALEQILNALPDQSQPLKQHWIAGVNVLMDIHLNDSLHEQYHKLDKQTNYTYYHPGRGYQTVTFLHDLMKVGLDKKGLGLSFSTVIKNYSSFDCGTPVPLVHRQTAQYGGIQQFMSLGLYKSTVAYALSQGYLDSTLNKETWQSHHFQFYVGDLYDVIPALQKNYYPRNELSGYCVPQTNGFSFARGGTDSFNVTLTYNCSLYANAADKIVDILINCSFNIQAKPFTNYTNFVVNSVDYNATYNPAAGFSIVNADLAQYYLNSTIHSLRGSKVFGSGFGAAARDYPHFEVNTEYVFLYDSANIHGDVMI